MKTGRTKSLKVITVLIIVALVAGLAVLLLMKGQKAKKTALKIIPDNVDIQVKNVVYTDVSADGTKWEVRADTGVYHRKENKALFDKVAVKLVLSDGRIYKMTGDKGLLGTESKNMEVSGHVTITSDRGDRITMDDLRYDDRDKLVRTDSLVVQENDRMKVQGRGMILSLVPRELKLLSAVKAVIK